MEQKHFDNIEKLKELVESGRGIFPIDLYIEKDGGPNVDEINSRWNKCFENFSKTKLWEGKTPEYNPDIPYQDEPDIVFIPSKKREKRATILVTHGGSFLQRTPSEASNIAWYFHNLGYNTAILSYRMLPYPRRISVEDELRAIKLLRSKKEEWGLGENVIAMGFSAGAMLSGNAATLYDLGDESSEDIVERFSSRPDAAVICYGAMSIVSYPHGFYKPIDEMEKSLYGETHEERFLYATEKQVNPMTPPMFIWQTLADDGRYGLTLAKALSDAGVPYELHIFEGAFHGVGLADGENTAGTDVPHITHWAELCDEWIRLHEMEC